MAFGILSEEREPEEIAAVVETREIDSEGLDARRYLDQLLGSV